MKLNIRYYDKNGYRDHGRTSVYGGVLPKVGDVISPFCGVMDNKRVQCKWRVIEVKDPPEDDSCYEIYFEDLGWE